MRVELVSHTNDPERTVAAAIRLCYSTSGLDELRKELDARESARLIKKVLQLGHLSVLEHASFTFAIEGISRACSHQLVRHRLASFSQQSQRYVQMSGFGFVVPSSIEGGQERMSRYQRLMEHLREEYDALLAAGVSPEDARYVLPNAAETRLLMTANARSLLNFFELRMCTRAQVEIRELAGLMLTLVKQAAPTMFSIAGPTCETRGYCREGNMTCGRAEPLQYPGVKEEK